MTQEKITGIEIFNGWKEIAKYLGKGVRTIQRYERELGLPVRRPAGKSAGSVLATKAELDAWVFARPLGGAFKLTQVCRDKGIIKEFRRNVTEMRRLRRANAELRNELWERISLLRTSIDPGGGRGHDRRRGKLKMGY